MLHFGTLPLHNALLENTVMLLIGFSVVPITSVGFAFSVELAFPVPEALTNGMMITFGLFWGTGLGFLCSFLQDQSPIYALTFWTISSIISVLVSLFIK